MFPLFEYNLLEIDVRAQTRTIALYNFKMEVRIFMI